LFSTPLRGDALDVETLVLDDVPEALWEAFQRGSTSALVHTDPAGLVDRWARARRLGAPIDGGIDDDCIERGASLSERFERLEGMLTDGASLLDGAASAAAERDFLLLVTDADGVVVHTAGGGGFADEARRVRLIAGANWSEGARGTNAIGTALLEDRPAVVRGRAHFGRRFHRLVCSAATVRGVDGRVVGVVDATSLLGASDVDVGFVVRTTARALEEVLRLRAYAGVGAAVADTLARSMEHMACPAMLVESSGRLGRVNAAARAAFGAVVGRASHTSLGLGWSVLRDEALGGSGRAVEVQGKPWRLRAEPLVAPDGAVLAVMAVFEPAARALGLSAARVSQSLAPADAFSTMYVEDPALREAVARARRFAVTDVPIVLLGETGSGKELMAQAIHASSRRASKPFVAVNCGAIAPQLLEAELFGAGPHAFTGADPKGRRGLIESAHTGTLFLDEVAEMPTPMQAALLRVLESGDLRRVGEVESRRVDVRLVCATCRDLPTLVTEGRFRSDLYYRLKGVSLTLPPLRSRRDLAGLARHLLTRLDAGASLDDGAVEALARHPWPGNVRELRSVLEVALALADEGVIRAEHLPLDAQPERDDVDADAPVLAEVEGSAVRRVLNEVAGNVSVAARRLGVARSTLYRMMRKHGLG
jgi:sigma-54 dependent transcriptional regulator, acetoin dehydrogenase operon transcriptional activator AcoR